ncbi:MAG: hypothetical protein ACLUDQ_10475, partial [Bilophila wadsworthia]
STGTLLLIAPILHIASSIIIRISRHTRRDFVTARHPALSVRAAIARINTQRGEELWRAVFGPAARVLYKIVI